MATKTCRDAIKIIYDNMERLSDMKQQIPYSDVFEQLSFSRYAAFEIVKLLSESKATDPITIIESFTAKMDYYSTLDSEHSWMFSVMHDASQNILDLVLDIILISEKEIYGS